MKYSTISLILATVLAVLASFGAIDVRSVAQDHTATPTTLASSCGLHRAQSRFALEPSTLLTCPAPASVTYGFKSSTNEHGNMDKMDKMMDMMNELLEIFHRLEQLLIEILAVWDKIAGIITKIAKFVKPPFPGSGASLWATVEFTSSTIP